MGRNEDRGKRTKVLIHVVVTALIILTIALPVLSDSNPAMSGSLVRSAPAIFINGDSDVQLGTTFPGSGTIEAPYCIENMTIDAGGSGNAIEIRNVVSYVSIKNCTVKRSFLSASYAGIKLENCQHIAVENCTITSNGNGIALYSSSNNMITYNNITGNNNNGLYLENADSNNVTGNLIHGNLGRGISLASNSASNKIAVNSFRSSGSGHFSWDSTGTGNVWFVGIIGNFWDDYTSRYPSAGNNLFTWNTPYVISPLLDQQDKYPLVSYTGIHAPIVIDGDAELDAFPDKTGAGNATHPYRIEDLKIGAGASRNCILIRNTNKFLVLDNLTLSGANIPLYDSGIMLEACHNVNVTNCRSVMNAVGMYALGCTNLSVFENQFIRNGYAGLWFEGTMNSSVFRVNASLNEFYGMLLDMCNNVSVRNSTQSFNEVHGMLARNSGLAGWLIVANNTFSWNIGSGIAFDSVSNVVTLTNAFLENDACGIDLYKAINCVTKGNTINGSRVGIYLRESMLNNLGDNVMDHCSIVLRSDASRDLMYLVDHVINSTNTIGGKPIAYITSTNGTIVGDLSGAGSVIVVNCTTGIIQDLDFSPATIGLQIYRSSNMTVKRCTFTDQRYAGLYSEDLTLSTIRDSTFIRSNKSIELRDGVYNNSIINNTIKDSWAGLFMRNTLWNRADANRFVGCGVWIEGDDYAYLPCHDIKRTNLVNQKTLYYYVNKTGLGLANFTNAGQIILVNCSYSTVGGCDVSNATSGVLAYFSNRNIFTQITSSFNSRYGMALFTECSFNSISQVVLKSNDDHGLLFLFNSASNVLSQATVSGNANAGVVSYFASHNTVKNSKITGNFHGIMAMSFANNITVSSNTIANNIANGIFITGSNDNKVVGNNVSFNSGVGIRIEPGSTGSRMYLNVVVGNALSEAFSSSPSNYWDNNSIGNFWGDYEARYPLANRTGLIWDTQYEINGTPGVFDRFPYYRNSVPAAAIAADKIIALVGVQVTFRYTGAIGDAPYQIEWDFGDGSGNVSTLNPVHVFSLQQNFTVTVTIRDRNDEISVARVVVAILLPDADVDGDGLTNADEILIHGTNPFAKDTDGDGFSDGDEIKWLTNPRDPIETPVTKWTLVGALIAVPALIVAVMGTRAIKNKQKNKKAQLPPARHTTTGPLLDLGSKAPDAAAATSVHDRLTEKQTMLSRILAPQTQSEMASKAAEEAERIEVEGLKAKKAKAGAAQEEIVERRVDEQLEAELNVQVKEERCIVCETSLKGTSYVCPFCKTKYCIRCAIMLSERQENCWACKNRMKFD